MHGREQPLLFVWQRVTLNLESVHNSEYDSVTSRGGQTSDGIQGNVRPGLEWHWERAKEPSGSMMWSFVACTNRTGSNILSHLFLHGGPPKMLFDNEHGPPNAWMTGETPCMGPLDDLRSERRRHKRGATLRDWSVNRCLPDSFLNFPCKGLH